MGRGKRSVANKKNPFRFVRDVKYERSEEHLAEWAADVGQFSWNAQNSGKHSGWKMRYKYRGE